MRDKLLLVLLLTLPFERVLTFGLLGYTAKLPYFAGILLVLYLFCDIYKKRKLDFSSDEIILFIFVFWSYLSIFWSIDRRLTFIVSTMFLLMAGIYFAVKKLCPKDRIESFFIGFIWLGVLTSVFSFYQFLGDMLGLGQKWTLLSDLYVKNIFGFPRVQSTFFEPGFFANFLLIPLFLSLYFALQKGRYYNLALLTIGTAFFLTLSRGGIFSFIIAFLGLAIVLMLYHKKLMKRIALQIAVLIISFIVALLIIFCFSGQAGVKAYLGQSVNSSDVFQASTENQQKMTRAYTIKVAVDNWKQHKLFGIGTGAFGALPEFEKIRQEGNYRQTVNSLYPEILVEEGIVGLSLLVIFIGNILVMAYAGRKNPLALTSMAAIVAIFIQYSSFSTLYFAYLWVFLALVALFVKRSYLSEESAAH